jgi:hypothetical protein
VCAVVSLLNKVVSGLLWLCYSVEPGSSSSEN